MRVRRALHGIIINALTRLNSAHAARTLHTKNSPVCLSYSSNSRACRRDASAAAQRRIRASRRFLRFTSTLQDASKRLPAEFTRFRALRLHTTSFGDIQAALPKASSDSPALAPPQRAETPTQTNGCSGFRRDAPRPARHGPRPPLPQFTRVPVRPNLGCWRRHRT